MLTRLSVRVVIALGCVLLLPARGARADSQARSEPPGLFVLPVQGDPWSGREEARLFDARLTTALARGRRVRCLGPRDIPARAQAALPKDLAACLTPSCVRARAAASGAGRVLASDLLEDGYAAVLFVTLFDGATGEVIDRRELPRATASPVTRLWAEEVARWVSHAPTPPSGTTGEVSAPAYARPLLVVELAPGQAARPEARALLVEVETRLRSHAAVVVARDPRLQARATHRAVIDVQRVAMTERPHHIHRYRRGVLTAVLAISEAQSGVVVFQQRADTEVTVRSEGSSTEEVVAELVRRAASRFLTALDEESPLPTPMPRSEQP